MNQYSEDNILNSVLATKVLTELNKQSNYGTKVAKDLDVSQTSVNRVIRKLHDMGFLQKGKRTQAQYYETDLDAMADYWVDSLEEYIPDSVEFDVPESTPEEVKKALNGSQTFEMSDSHRELAKKFFKLYIDHNLRQDYEVELRGIFYMNLLFNWFNYVDRNEPVKALEPFIEALVRKIGLINDREGMEDIIEEYEDEIN